jgi:hypothetical protein
MVGDLTEGSLENGIVPRAVDHIFRCALAHSAPAQMHESTDDSSDVEMVSAMLGAPQYVISLSYMEIYKSALLLGATAARHCIYMRTILIVGTLVAVVVVRAARRYTICCRSLVAVSCHLMCAKM